jgi:hypothetical protein
MPEERIAAHRLAALILHLRPEAPGSRVKLTNR